MAVNPEVYIWRAMFDQQTETMRALLRTLETPKIVYRHCLPLFDPATPNADARSWIITAELCFCGSMPTGGHLVLALSRVFRGEASIWLTQIASEDLTWSNFKELFSARFILHETLAANLIKLKDQKPRDNERLPAYASRITTCLLNNWKEATKEEIAIAATLAHLSQSDERMRHLAFTKDIKTRQQLLQELNAVSQMTQNNSGETSNVLHAAGARPTIKCFTCGKTGHKRAQCKNKRIGTIGRSPVMQQQTRTSVCYKCGRPGHIATWCTSAGEVSGLRDSGAGVSRDEPRVDVSDAQSLPGTSQD